MRWGRRKQRGDEAFTGPRNMFLLLLLIGIAGSIWGEFREIGEGVSENPRKILFAPREPRPGIRDVLLSAGFHVEDGAGADGLAALIQRADAEGLGFLVTDHTPKFTAPLPEVAGASWPADDRWVALSIGDLAFPPHLTASPGLTSGELDEGVAVLETIYDQPRLDPTRESLTHHPALDEVMLNARLEPGMNMMARARSQHRLSYEMERRLAGRLTSDPGVRPLFEPLQIGGAVSAGESQLLITRRRLRFVRAAGSSLKDVLAEQLEFERWQIDGAGAVIARESCDEVFGGPIDAETFNLLRVSRDGHHVVLQRRSGRLSFFEATDEEGCGYRQVADGTMDADHDVGVIGDRGIAAGVMPTEDGDALVFRAGDEMISTPAIRGATLRAPTWLDANRVLAAIESRDARGVPTRGLLLVNVFTPSTPRVVTFPAEVAAAAINQVVAAPGSSEVIVSMGRGPTRLYRVLLSGEGVAWRRTDPLPESLALETPGGEEVRSPRALPMEALATAGAVEMALLWAEEDAYDPVVDSTGSVLTFAASGGEWFTDHDTQMRRYRVEALDLEAARGGAAVSRLSRVTGMTDRKPAMVHGTDFVVVSSRGSLGLGRRVMVSPRLMRLRPIE